MTSGEGEVGRRARFEGGSSAQSPNAYRFDPVVS